MSKNKLSKEAMEKVSGGMKDTSKGSYHRTNVSNGTNENVDFDGIDVDVSTWNSTTTTDATHTNTMTDDDQPVAGPGEFIFPER